MSYSSVYGEQAFREMAAAESARDDLRAALRVKAQPIYPKAPPTEDAVRELARWRGQNLTPRRGCLLTRMILGDAEVVVEYEYQPAQAAQGDPDRPCPGPGFAASVEILQVLINGRMCDAEDVIPEATLDLWREKIAENWAEQS